MIVSLLRTCIDCLLELLGEECGMQETVIVCES